MKKFLLVALLVAFAGPAQAGPILRAVRAVRDCVVGVPCQSAPPATFATPPQTVPMPPPAARPLPAQAAPVAYQQPTYSGPVYRIVGGTLTAAQDCLGGFCTPRR